ncbi:MAG: response regulator [Ignavibacteria bacterium]|jgi:signal transduction histidine kinase
MEDPKNETILIVDDIPEDVDILKELLAGYKKVVALNGETALQIINESPPDLILLDIIMPGMSGHYVCERIKADDKTKEIPIIFITAMDEVADIIKGFQLGAVDYITKPFQPEEVLSRVKTHLQLSSFKKRLLNINKELQEKVDERTAELIAEKDKAVEANRIKSDFLMLMSHELRTPMGGILGFADILRNEIKDEEHRDIAETLYSAAERLRDTLNSILALSQLESTKLKPHPVEIDIIARINKLLPSHEIKAKAKNLEIFFEQDNEELVAKIDPAMFDVIFNNIVSNAIKFTPKGSIHIKTFRENGYDCFSVTDTGIGIPGEKHKIIFEEFRQVEEGVCRNFQGVGLGLSLVKKYVDLQKGKIFFESEVNKGTRFTIMLPTTYDKTKLKIKPGKTVEKFFPSRLEKKYGVLLVEDDPTNIKITEIYLENYAVVDTALNGLQALELVKKNNYSAILMDINLGQGKTGIEVTKEIKKIDKYNDTPIIAFTAFAMDGDKENFLSEGCTHYLAKPFSREELITSLFEAVNYKKSVM